jgi:hypothetical protein
LDPSNRHPGSGESFLNRVQLQQTAELTEVPHTANRATRVKVNHAIARHLLAGLGVSAAEAAAWGQTLRAAARQAVSEFAALR